MTKSAIAFVLLALSPFSAAQWQSETIKHCKADQIVGFERQGLSWARTHFNASLNFEVKENGMVMMNLNGKEEHFVEAEFTSAFIRGSIGFQNFMMSKKTGKFNASFFGGYINDNPSQVPWIAVGSCR